jgi:hypothetical protein
VLAVALLQQTSLSLQVAAAVEQVAAAVQVDYCYTVLNHLLQIVIQLQLEPVALLVSLMLVLGMQQLTDQTLNSQL